MDRLRPELAAVRGHRARRRRQRLRPSRRSPHRARAAIDLAVAAEPPDRVPPTYSNIALLRSWLEAWSGAPTGGLRRRGRGGVPPPRLLHRVRLTDLLRDRSAGAGPVAAIGLPTPISDATAPGSRRRSGPTSPAGGTPASATCAAPTRGPTAWTSARTSAGCPWRCGARGCPPRCHRSTPTSSPTATTCAWPRCSSTWASVFPTPARPAFERFTGARAVRQVIEGSPRREASGWLEDALMIGGEDGDTGLQARGQFHPATVHWRQPDGTVGWLRVEHHGPDTGPRRRAPPRGGLRRPPSPRRRSPSGGSPTPPRARSRPTDGCCPASTSTSRRPPRLRATAAALDLRVRPGRPPPPSTLPHSLPTG